MNPKIVDNLEKKIEESIAEAIAKLGLKQLPLLPSQRTMHLIAKAAVTVYETLSRTMPDGRGELRLIVPP